ncbi:MAG: protein-L-isoaspartate(D-aspartate) O-methyltransferase [Roseovarius sp.]|nr:protein-L-isoaspartate(D-aspartate) O-methyltransferase [Roseovarius sp.]MCY4208798.1 protein-L-isoaspartate(D-aspartate) O-methyltransferase [Roseovarius sp.]MCY4290527.1 protein-L-isoaspartate(D-aspartate) O-methyltransferase [Roseovarius sp.]MCY4314582.1 protein-L-isoaspartate(D-aspartate) O-methyltransferase [Roseovarius sp.]
MSNSTTNISERKMRFIYTLRSNGVTCPRVLSTMETIDRGEFVHGHFASRAYEDTPLPIACGQTISQPSIVGLMTQALNVGERDTVLEVGTGSGYQTAILSRLARRVYSVDRHRQLVTQSEKIFRKLDLTNIIAFTADGTRGLFEQAPFDRIMITAAAEDTPGPLLEQLKVGGVMVLPVGPADGVQSLIQVSRHESGFNYEELLKVRFVPLMEGLGEDS